MDLLKKYGMMVFLIGYMDAVWFLVYGIADRHDLVDENWLGMSCGAVTVTHIVMFVVTAFKWANSEGISPRI